MISVYFIFWYIAETGVNGTAVSTEMNFDSGSLL